MPAPRPRDGWAIAAGLLALYSLLGQDCFYKTDGQALLWLRQQGLLHHAYHTFYLPLLAALQFVAEPLGASLFETARALSALGSAFAAFLVHAACGVLGLSRLEARIATLAFGLCPGVVFFATVVEVHGPFLPFAGLAMLAIAAAVRRPGIGRGALAGLALGLAYLAHPTGALLGAALPVVFFAARPRGRGISLLPPALLRTGGAAALLLAAWVVVVPPLLRSFIGATVDAGTSLQVLFEFTGGPLLAPVELLRVFVTEYLLPILPSSVLALAAFPRPDARPAAAWLVVAVLVYAFAAQLLLRGFSERGAYLLPLAWPAALAALHPLRHHRFLAAPGLVLAAAVAIAQVRLHDHSERVAALARGVVQVAGDARRVYWIAGHPEDVETYFVHLEHVPLEFLGPLVGLGPDAADKALAELDTHLRAAWAHGYTVLISRKTLQELQDATRTGKLLLSDDPLWYVPAPAAPRILSHLRGCYVLEPVAAAGFTGVRVRPR